ncbi:hypothetical protein HS088_TW04G01156 [Tripterygium wilfordii]|uniref:Uncharacterized protein n=1 Tax=Tripterygium wilfordii TaxID=458696 RepID=A0A7J7DSC0_TRIWF|nr:hypothetical protein HS088_TW04G01156 [Tripterygium wilfordii]
MNRKSQSCSFFVYRMTVASQHCTALRLHQTHAPSYSSLVTSCIQNSAQLLDCFQLIMTMNGTLYDMCPQCTLLLSLYETPPAPISTKRKNPFSWSSFWLHLKLELIRIEVKELIFLSLKCFVMG